jgi:hypothetical protein
LVDITQMVAGDRWRGWRIAMWGGAAFLLLLPAVAMRLTSEVEWDARDFVATGIMLAAACSICELAARVSSNCAYQAAAGVAVGTAFLIVWANLAVGMIGDEGNPFNLLFGGVLAVALTGSIVARFEPSGMVGAMALTAAAQIAAGAVGLSADPRGALTAMAFAAPWLLSAWLFRKAALAA